MKVIRVDGASARGRDVDGRVLVHDLGPDLRKGTVLGGRHLDRIRQAGEVHLVELEAGDLHEDEAAKRLAAALSGPGLEAQPPVQSQARMVARHRGLIRVRAELVDAINALGHISVFTLMDGQAVAEGEEVAGCKVTPVAVPGDRAEMSSLLDVIDLLARESRAFHDVSDGFHVSVPFADAIGIRIPFGTVARLVRCGKRSGCS